MDDNNLGMEYKSQIEEGYGDDVLTEFEEEEIETLPRRFPPWVVAFVTVLVLVSFIALSLPNLSLYVGKRFDFLSQNASLGNDPLVINARDTIASITSYEVKNIPGNNRSGTGFLISADGYIITNYHVVDGAKKIKIELKNGDVYYTAKYTHLSNLDAAIIDIDAVNLPYLTIASDSLPKENETVTVVGNPLGFMRVAARGTMRRYLELADEGLVMEIEVNTKPGSSGSPVINSQGQAIGIVFAILTQKSNKETKNTTLAIPLYLLDKDLHTIISEKN